MPHSIGRLSASASSHPSLSLAAFITNIAESDFRYTQPLRRRATRAIFFGRGRFVGQVAPARKPTHHQSLDPAADFDFVTRGSPSFEMRARMSGFADASALLRMRTERAAALHAREK
jgi:hypothetical protein